MENAARATPAEDAAPAPGGPVWRFLIQPRWMGWHLLMVVSFVGMLWLGDWQFHRAIAGNGLSWAYTFEWPLFAVFAVVFWAKTIKDEFHPPAVAEPGTGDIPLPAGAMRQGGPDGATVPAGEPASPEEEADLAAYNRYLARLHQEVRGHGKWHGLR